MAVVDLETKADKETREITEYFARTAKVRKISYDAHIQEGFTTEQAQWLCCAHETD